MGGWDDLFGRLGRFVWAAGADSGGRSIQNQKSGKKMGRPGPFRFEKYVDGWAGPALVHPEFRNQEKSWAGQLLTHPEEKSK